MYRRESQHALHLLRERHENIVLGRNCLSYRQISASTHIPKSDLWLWDHQDMSNAARVSRAELHAWNRVLSIEMQWEVGGFIIYRNITYQDTLTFTIRKYISLRFDVTVDETYVSRLRKVCHLSSRKVIKVMRGALSQNSIEKAIDRLTEFRSLHVPPEQIVVVDKIYFSDTPSHSTQTAMVGMCGFRQLSLLKLIIDRFQILGVIQ
jgi:hypothetical protein